MYHLRLMATYTSQILESLLVLKMIYQLLEKFKTYTSSTATKFYSALSSFIHSMNHITMLIHFEMTLILSPSLYLMNSYSCTYPKVSNTSYFYNFTPCTMYFVNMYILYSTKICRGKDYVEVILIFLLE